MTKARTLADFVSSGNPLADGTISVAEVVGAAPLASPTFTGTLNISSSENNVALFDGSHATSTQMFLRNSNTGTGLYTVLGFAPSNNVSGATITTFAEEDFSEAANRTARLEIETRDNGNWMNRLTMGRLEAVFNDDSDATDFRVESNNNTHALFVDGGTTQIGMGATVNSTAHLNVEGVVNTDYGGMIRVDNKGTDGCAGFIGVTNGGWSIGQEKLIIGRMATGGVVNSASAEFTISNSEYVFNENSNDRDFRVESDSNSQAIYLDGATSALRLDCSGAVQTSKANWLTGAQNQLEVGVASQPSYNSGVSYGGIKFRDNGWGSPVFSIAASSNSGNGTVRGYGNYVDFVIKTNSGSNTFATPLALRPTSVIVTGSLSKSSGSFRIPHPVASKTETHDLVHSFVEGPQADNIYRGKVDLVSGAATVNIDIVAGMTDGTFDALNREVQCFTTNESGWTAIKGSVSGNILTITAQDNDCADTISWMVIGERKDVHMYDTDWTDDNGKVIVEPLKSAEE